MRHGRTYTFYFFGFIPYERSIGPFYGDADAQSWVKPWARWFLIARADKPRR